MGIGGSIFLIALGAILTFAVNADIGVLDLSVVGWVLMIAGFAGLVITIWFWQNRRRAVATDPAARPQGQVVGEYREVRREQPPL
ncbi:MAG TPA: DUF6458 family protein [Actinoplanes sp.]|nr:DUF6458 family protein [Actinoplanes sp.]